MIFVLPEMRPDKKKTRHHDSRKREAIAKEKIAKSKNPHDTGRKGAETAQAAEVGPTGDDDGRYSKRNICSNWTKYEVSSEDEESGSDDVGHSMTGEDFNYVLQNAGRYEDGLCLWRLESRVKERRTISLFFPAAATSDSLFRLKSERLWEEDKQIFANELFALDLKDLEAAIGTLPLQQQVDFAKEDLNPVRISTMHSSFPRQLQISFLRTTFVAALCSL